MRLGHVLLKVVRECLICKLISVERVNVEKGIIREKPISKYTCKLSLSSCALLYCQSVYVEFISVVCLSAPEPCFVV